MDWQTTISVGTFFIRSIAARSLRAGIRFEMIIKRCLSLFVFHIVKMMPVHILVWPDFCCMIMAVCMTVIGLSSGD